MTYSEETIDLVLQGSPIEQLRAALAAAEELNALCVEWTAQGLRYDQGETMARQWDLGSRVSMLVTAMSSGQVFRDLDAPTTREECRHLKVVK
jgi:nicotinamidase-related amidase